MPGAYGFSTRVPRCIFNRVFAVPFLRVSHNVYNNVSIAICPIMHLDGVSFNFRPVSSSLSCLKKASFNF